MALFLDDISAYLQDQGIGTEGTDLFVSEIPDEGDVPDLVVCLFEYAGRGRDFLGYARPGLHVDVRGAKGEYNVARAKIETIIATLHKIFNSNINGTYYLAIEATGEPFPNGFDSKSRPTVSVNFRVTKKA